MEANDFIVNRFRETPTFKRLNETKTVVQFTNVYVNPAQ